MLNLKFVILRSLSKLCASLAVKSEEAKKRQAWKCREKQVDIFGKANTAVYMAEQFVEADTVELEQARAEAIARVNMEYNKKIAGLQVSIDAAQEYAEKQYEKLEQYTEAVTTS
jgi:acyl-ACP thioesterase